MSGIDSGNLVLQGADSFIFYDDRIFAYDDMISVSVPNAEMQDLKGAVKAEEFFKIISKMPSEEIRLEVSDKNTWILKSRKARAELALVDFDYENRLNEIKISDDWIKVGDDFISGINFCKMSKNSTPLSGIYVKENHIMSTDGFQMNRFELKDSSLPEFWISDKSVAELSKFSELNNVQVQGNWVHFKSENNVVFSLKTLTATNYPFDKVNGLVENVNFAGMIHGEFPKGLKEVIERANVFDMNLESHSAVKLVFDGEGVEVSSANAVGNYSEKLLWEDGNKNFEKFELYVDSGMIVSASQKALEFYLQTFADKKAPRLYFVTDSSVHLMSTIILNKE
jgi:DNA polymerase III sliding clamp (beta) subunit (PCNA family)